MPRKHIVILSILVFAPILAFFALSWRLVQADQARTRRQFEDLLEANLNGIDRTIADYFASVEQRLLSHDIDVKDMQSLLALTRTEPLIEQIIVLESDGRLVYPQEPLSRQELNYLMKISDLVENKTLARLRQKEQTQSTAPQATYKFKVLFRNRPVHVTVDDSDGAGHGTIAKSVNNDHGWHTWYWGSGIQLIHWRELDDQRILAIGLQRARWMADIIAMLPESNPDSLNRTAPAQIRLVNAEGGVIYLWGSNTNIPEDQRPVTTLHLGLPLRPWQLQHFGPSQPLNIGSTTTSINLLAAGGLLSAGLLALAIYLSREIGRQTREARQRVNFVNQVSHELKTPLTNIRMYADLLEHDLERMDPHDEMSQAHLAVITGESGRLSRLINNVLTFARLGRNVPPTKPQAGVIDDAIMVVVEQFRPSLDKLGIEVSLDLDATQEVRFDVDCVEQMLGNLISNVEKYGKSGKHVRIASRFQNGITTIDVSDAGPGIAPDFAKRIFTPFTRASDHIVSATGTGIGLAITRSLAQRNGGDLVLRESSIGAAFRLTLATPLCDGST